MPAPSKGLSYLWGIETYNIPLRSNLLDRGLSYLWGIETRMLFPNLVSKLIGFIVPMRNWNEEGKSKENKINWGLSYLWGIETLSFSASTRFLARVYRTYEELKHGDRFIDTSWYLRGLSYLWGIETFSTTNSSWNSLGVYRTYEELKPVTALEAVQDLLGFIVPMRNWNRISGKWFYFPFFGFIVPMRNWNT